jgi:hypothetical protein
VLIGEGLQRNLPEGRFSRLVMVYRAVAVGLLLVVAAWFGATQVRVALHPVLDRHGDTLMPQTVYLEELAAEPAEAEFDEEVTVRAMKKRALREAPVSVTSFSAADLQALRVKSYQPDPQARITTGPGLPAWAWNRVTLFWSGPVDSDQQLGFVLMPPWLVSLFGFLRVALMAALAIRLIGVDLSSGDGGGSLSSWLRARGSAGAAAAIAALLVTSAAQPARAEFPPQELLDQLRAGLLEKPDCYPRCASIPRLRLDVESGALTLRLEVDAAADTAIALPGDTRNWSPTEVSLDGAPARGLRRDQKGVLWVRLTPGRHQLVCRGAIPDRDSVELPFPMQPKRVEVKSRDWQVHGLREDGTSEPALQLTRKRREVSNKLEPGELPPFLLVKRKLMLGLEWRADTEVVRATPDDTAILIEVPLLPGESIISEKIRVRDGKAIVSLAPGERRVGWTSQLEVGSALMLSAPEGVAWTESWRLDVSPIWHVEVDGIPPIHADAREGARVREWRPWPGESIQLDIRRPTGVEGATLTIDNSLLHVVPGLRSTDATLTLSLRSSRGGRHSIGLPEEASLQSVSVDGQAQPIRQEGRSVAVPIHPGAQKLEIAWREPRGFSDKMLLRTPALDLGAPSVNAQISLAPSIGRWVLALGGTGMGPVVLFWSMLVALSALAFGLSRLTLTPLRFHEWLLLGIGLTQAPVLAAAIVALWLLALGWRAQRGTALPGRWFDLLQLALVALSGAALIALLFSINRGLLGSPEMQIAGNGSNAHLLRWYQDRASATPAQAWLFSVPVLVYRLAMLAWALWLAQALLRWLRWGWQCFTSGELWRPLRPPKNLSPKN